MSEPRTLPDLLAALEYAAAECLPEDAPALIGELQRMQATVQARMISALAHPDGHPEASAAADRLLTVKEAAQRLGVSADWLYRHARTLPFVVRLGAGLRFSARGIERYIRQRRGR